MDIEEMRKAYNRATRPEQLKMLSENRQFRHILLGTTKTRSKEEEITLYECRCLFKGNTPMVMCKTHTQSLWAENQHLRQQINELKAAHNVL